MLAGDKDFEGVRRLINNLRRGTPTGTSTTADLSHASFSNTAANDTGSANGNTAPSAATPPGPKSEATRKATLLTPNPAQALSFESGKVFALHKPAFGDLVTGHRSIQDMVTRELRENFSFDGQSFKIELGTREGLAVRYTVAELAKALQGHDARLSATLGWETLLQGFLPRVVKKASELRYSLEQFLSYWMTVHVELGKGAPGPKSFLHRNLDSPDLKGFSKSDITKCQETVARNISALLKLATCGALPPHSIGSGAHAHPTLSTESLLDAAPQPLTDFLSQFYLWRNQRAGVKVQFSANDQIPAGDLLGALSYFRAVMRQIDPLSNQHAVGDKALSIHAVPHQFSEQATTAALRSGKQLHTEFDRCLGVVGQVMGIEFKKD